MKIFDEESYGQPENVNLKGRIYNFKGACTIVIKNVHNMNSIYTIWRGTYKSAQIQLWESENVRNWQATLLSQVTILAGSTRNHLSKYKYKYQCKYKCKYKHKFKYKYVQIGKPPLSQVTMLAGGIQNPLNPLQRSSLAI